MTKPYSSIMFKCEVIETNILSNKDSRKRMKIKLLKKYKKDEFNIEKLKTLGVKSVRGPRRVTKALSEELKIKKIFLIKFIKRRKYMLHKMKLNESPFERIKNGSKTIEFRLYDEKRQKVKIGDKIEFSKLPDLQEKLLVDVTGLSKENSFYELFKKLYNDEEEIKEKTNSMYEIYSKEKEIKYGVLGIKIKINVDNLKENINNFVPYNEQEEVEKNIMLKFINDFDDVLTRENVYGHFTSSAFVLNKERTKILMIYHKIYNSWAWTGGHCDGDNNLLYVAMKEAKEETGIKNVKPILNDIYSLELISVRGHIKKGKYVASHTHFNVTYLLEADENEEIHIKEDENIGVKWVPIDEILDATSETWVRDRVYSKIINKMKKDGIIKK